MTAPSVTTQEVTDPDAMHHLGVHLGERLQAGDLVVLTGPLGAGKTTLTRGIGEGIGVRGPVTSPTFVIARTHPSTIGGPALVHVDAYRLHDADELDDLDIDFDHSVVIVEWGAGLVRPNVSWIELVISRPTGAQLPTEQSTTAQADGTSNDANNDANDPTDWSQTLVEPRTVTITGHGPRWAQGVLV